MRCRERPATFGVHPQVDHVTDLGGRGLRHAVPDMPGPPRLPSLDWNVMADDQLAGRANGSHHTVGDYGVPTCAGVARLVWPGVINRMKGRFRDDHDRLPGVAVLDTLHGARTDQSAASEGDEGVLQVRHAVQPTPDGRRCWRRAPVSDRLRFDRAT